MRECFEAAGIYHPGVIRSAKEAGDLWIISTTLPKYVPFGSTFYFNGSTPDGHVGIYLGDGKILHAAETVRVDMLSSLLHLVFRGYGFQAGIKL